ncbi:MULTISPECIES: glycosyltransferase [unclassified Nitratiruptor]|uniref:glycosyltransferase n=1 Tax=unclassified Nitratiruptor TaxID=2624044 RepID=UPI00191561AA|nr:MULTISPECIES: glycosyltransferase [unclassified Nitratiruptor]BCD60701.1 glycosyl transferase [Nitratiruptor sp. YY08-10]BCD64634.1 glycosyl transferase [Nitratiruptor sp. YY08-14]
MKAIILTPALVPFDAVSNDVRQQHKVLNEIIPTYIYTDSFSEDGYSSSFLIDRAKLEKLSGDKENILIYHHSVYWGLADELLPSAKAKIFIKYHNITPPQFFAPYNKTYEHICRMGILQNERLKRLNARYLADSSFNAKDFPNAEVVPVFTLLDDFEKKIDTEFADKLLNNQLNILFVGRFAPNKGHTHLVKTVYFLKEYGLNPMLHIAGGIDEGLETYYQEIKDLISFYYLKSNIKIYDKLPFTKLITLFKTSDIFLLLSEHEGFCVPILESQKSSLPIVCVDRTAIKETIGKGQIVLEDFEYNTIAATIYTLHKNPSFQTFLTAKGRENLKRFSYEHIKKLFLGAIFDCVDHS